MARLLLSHLCHAAFNHSVFSTEVGIMKRILATLGMVLLLAFGATGARADVIDLWSYEIKGVFTSWTNDKHVSWDYGVGANTTDINASGEATLQYDYFKGVPAPGSKTGATKLTWGDNPTQPNYAELGVNTGTVQTGGALVPGLTLMHVNMPQSPAATIPLSGSALLTMALAAGPGLVNPVIFATQMDFYYINSPSKWDLFVVEDPLVLSTETFPFGSETYQFSFANSFAQLYGEYATEARSLLGWADDKPVYGWITTAGNGVHFDSYFTITRTVPVPEPATMMLVGIGLAGLGAMARKRRQA